MWEDRVRDYRAMQGIGERIGEGIGEKTGEDSEEKRAREKERAQDQMRRIKSLNHDEYDVDGMWMVDEMRGLNLRLNLMFDLERSTAL